MRGLRRVAVSLVILAMLSGCASPVGARDRAASSGADRLVVTDLVVDATGITAVRSTGVAQSRISFDDGDDAVVDFLSGILGTPRRTYPQLTGCLGSRQLIAWTEVGLEVEVPLVASERSWSPTFFVNARTPEARTRVAISVPGAGALGEKVGDWVARFDSDAVFDPFGDDTLVAYDTVPDHPDFFGGPGLYGAIAHIDESGALVSLRAPTSFPAYYC